MAAALLVAAPEHADAQRRLRDRITREEIEASPHKAVDIYQVIRSLRPHFLQGGAGTRSFSGSSAQGLPIAVYVDGRRDAGVDALKTLQARIVEEVRYLDPTQSANEFGPQSANGAIIVRLRRQPRAPATPPSEG